MKIQHLRDYIHFRPTFLYLKRHRVTGLLYFGKTCKWVEEYRGSGRYWLNHLKKHGDNVETVWYCLFTNKEDLYQFATTYSLHENIVKSKEYANQIIEEGFNGGTRGHTQNRLPYFHTEESKQNRRNKIRAVDKSGNKLGLVDKNDPRFLTGEVISVHGNKYTKECRDRIQESRKNYRASEETKKKISDKLKGRVRPIEESKKAGASLKGRAPAKNAITGEYVGFISILDERWKSGEVISNFKGKKLKPSP